MTEPEAVKPWPAWRIARLMRIFDYKAQGLTNEEVAEQMPISESTVQRELISPQADEIGDSLRNRASGLMWALTDRQVKQIETLKDKPVSQLVQRGRLINTLASLFPRRVEQKISGELSAEVKMIDVTEEDLLSVVAPAVRELVRREARDQRRRDALDQGEEPEEPSTL